MRARRWSVFISGRGSNLAAALDGRRECEGLYDVALVVSSSDEAAGLARARRDAVPTLVLPGKIEWPELTRTLRGRGVTHILLAGFMRIVRPEFCREWAGHLFNLHPSLLPSYPGLDSIARARADGRDVGATIHEAIEAVDAGRIHFQRRSISGADALGASENDVEFRVHVDEQRLVRHALERLSSRRTS